MVKFMALVSTWSRISPWPSLSCLYSYGALDVHRIDIVVQRSGWTKDLDIFLQWLSTMCFSGGGFSEGAIAEGLSEALMMLLVSINASDNHQSPEVQKHCVLVAASNPYPLPTPVYRPPISSLEHKENTEVQKESFLADAETVAKSFSQCFVSLSVISPKQLPKLRSIYDAVFMSPSQAI
ncbi:mediator of RNA polymerase II transcription subunit 25-like isoform X2 [Zingiber officinale]|uniref:mediator of RNA polymerase II transcription subunit 25-like isoform X2 n=1 Tax=Zingiber officinale TaxID=94328 RepID=UPI001C4BDC09|nr:mediator of RNA polymerase II transcription subunit 25-like isoform X2 [Zingiber officinale]